MSFINESKFAYELAQARVHALHARSDPAVSSRPATFHARPIFISVIKLIHKILLTNTGVMSTIKVPRNERPRHWSSGYRVINKGSGDKNGRRQTGATGEHGFHDQ